MILAPTLLLNAGSGAAIARPTFSRDFAGEKTLDNGTGPAITFTRASNATFFDASGTLQTASNNVARFDHDPADGNKSRGLLIEEARTNSIVQSEDLSTTWTASGITVTTNQTTAPDGTSNADLIETTLTNVAHNIATSITWAAVTYTFSVFAKYKDHQWITLRSGVGGSVFFATFDLLNSAIGTATAGVTHSITNVGNGWYRLIMTSTITATGSAGALIILNDADDLNNTAYTGTGTGAYLWGAQLEAGAFPTSYIPTTTAAATRSADSAVVTPISSFYNQAEGTLFAEYSGAEPSAGRGVVQFSDGSLDNRVAITTAGTTAIPNGSARVATVNQAAISVGSAPLLTDVIKFIFGAAVDNFQAARGGTLGTADTSGTMPTGLTTLRLGAPTAASSILNGHIRKLAYYPRRLSNTLLQQLTT